VADILITARQHRFSRFPVYQDDLTTSSASSM